MGEQTQTEPGAPIARVDVTPAPRVCAITVTHGDRQHLMRRVLLSLLKEPAIGKIVMVTNGVAWDVQGLVNELDSGRVEAIEFDRNRGSAAAFAAGIKRASELAPEFIWLLDGDNEPQGDALARLLDAHADLSKSFPKDNVAVVAFRPGKQTDLAAGTPLSRLKKRRSSFLGFHIYDLPAKLWRRTRWGRRWTPEALPAFIDMPVAMFGGLLFHRAVVEKHGLPREDFILYADDSEFTNRITQSGGAVRLVTAARIADLDAPWFVERRSRNAFHIWLEGGPDSRVFYSARNHVYFESHCLPQSRLMFWLNRRAFYAVLWTFALIFRRPERYRLLRRAFRDGLAGRLGVAPDLPVL